MSRMMRQLRGRPELLSIPLVAEAADRIELLERKLAEVAGLLTERSPGVTTGDDFVHSRMAIQQSIMDALAEPTTYWAVLLDPDWRQCATVAVPLEGRLPSAIKWEGRYYHCARCDLADAMPGQVIRYFERRPDNYFEPLNDDIVVVGQGPMDRRGRWKTEEGGGT